MTLDANGVTQPCVWLVGAGPGDPELLTIKAWRVLTQADVVLVDDLVDARITDGLSPHTRVLRVGKRGGCVSTDQGFINALLVREARRGARVVRLKGGDPFVFGRGGEERDALRAAGIVVRVVPGVTAGLAAAASVGVSVTDRRQAPGVAFVTGHGREGGDAVDWAALVRSRLTLVIYMGVARADAIQGQLLDAGMPADMPCLVVSSATTPRQRHAGLRLDGLAAAMMDQGLQSPAIIVVGRVASAAQALDLADEAMQRAG